MELTLTDDQEFLVETVDKFLATEIPMAAVRRLAATAEGFDPAQWQHGASLGWTSFLVPEEHGGGTVSGHGVADLALVAELFGRHVAPGPLVPTNVAALLVARAGRDEQRAAVLPGLVAGELVAAWCDGTTGPEPLRVARDGDAYVLTGSVTPVEAATQADVLVVTATDGAGVRHFVVRPAALEGASVQPLQGLDVVRRFAAVGFDECRLPADAELSGGGDGRDLARHAREVAIVLHASESTGAAGRVFEFTLEWAFDRYSFGRPLASYQEIKHRFADMRMWLEACRATTTGAVRGIDEPGANSSELVSVAKAYVDDHASELIQDCVQIHGGIGVTWEHDIHLFLRRVTTNWAQYGTPAEHREQLAAMVDAATRTG